jgi:hypothetical protein
LEGRARAGIIDRRQFPAMLLASQPCGRNIPGRAQIMEPGKRRRAYLPRSSIVALVQHMIEQAVGLASCPQKKKRQKRCYQWNHKCVYCFVYIPSILIYMALLQQDVFVLQKIPAVAAIIPCWQQGDSFGHGC